MEQYAGERGCRHPACAAHDRAARTRVSEHRQALFAGRNRESGATRLQERLHERPDARAPFGNLRLRVSGRKLLENTRGRLSLNHVNVFGGMEKSS